MTHSHLHSASPHCLFFMVQRSTLKNNLQGRKPHSHCLYIHTLHLHTSPLLEMSFYGKDTVRYALLVHYLEFGVCSGVGSVGWYIC